MAKSIKKQSISSVVAIYDKNPILVKLEPNNYSGMINGVYFGTIDLPIFKVQIALGDKNEQKFIEAGGTDALPVTFSFGIMLVYRKVNNEDYQFTLSLTGSYGKRGADKLGIGSEIDCPLIDTEAISKLVSLRKIIYTVEVSEEFFLPAMTRDIKEESSKSNPRSLAEIAKQHIKDRQGSERDKLPNLPTQITYRDTAA